MSISKIVVVCTGNICRSPIAEALLKARAADAKLQICSAGTHAVVGAGIDSNSQAVLRHHGHDLPDHVAQQANQVILGWADIVLTLDQGHNQWITARFPHLLGRVFKLTKWRGNADVEDPYLKDVAVFSRIYNEISDSVDDWLSKLRRL